MQQRFRHPVLLIFSVFMFLLCLSQFSHAAQSNSLDGMDPEDMPSDMPGYSMEAIRELADLIQRTGLGPDKIPPLNRPRYMSLSDASLSMDNDEIVFVMEFPGNYVRIYPQRIMVWHEIVNDMPPGMNADTSGLALPGTGSGEGYTLSYCPLTGSVLAFRSMASKYPSSFGVSGNLLNGNSILYDRVSRSLWSQLMATCVEGPFRGKRLERIPVLWARWGGIKERYGGLDSHFGGTAQVLSRSTGYRRSYGKDPYGSYHNSGTYYDNNIIPFPVSFMDPRLHPKEQILGMEIDNAFGALRKQVVKRQGVLNFTLGITPLVAVYDPGIDSIRVFRRHLPNMEQPLTFTIVENKLLDENTKSVWQNTGRCVTGRLRDTQLVSMTAVDAMWFAWASFYRGSQIFPYRDF